MVAGGIVGPGAADTGGVLASTAALIMASKLMPHPCANRIAAARAIALAASGATAYPAMVIRGVARRFESGDLVSTCSAETPWCKVDRAIDPGETGDMPSLPGRAGGGVSLRSPCPAPEFSHARFFDRAAHLERSRCPRRNGRQNAIARHRTGHPFSRTLAGHRRNPGRHARQSCARRLGRDGAGRLVGGRLVPLCRRRFVHRHGRLDADPRQA